MQEFSVYLRLGFEHLLDINTPDHIFFILMLALPYSIQDWKKLFFLATAFTVGHSITLAIAVFTNPQTELTSWIEFLIALTIALTAVLNFFEWKFYRSMYGMVVIFGLIHGYGFSGLLKSLLEGIEWSVMNTLLPFNVGLEIAQIFWISIILVFNTWIKYPYLIKKIVYILTFSISLFWAWERLPL